MDEQQPRQTVTPSSSNGSEPPGSLPDEVSTDAIKSPPQSALPGHIPEFSASDTPVTPATNKKRKWKVVLIAVSSAIVLGGAGAFAYLGVIVPNKPESIVKAALVKQIITNSGEFSGEVSVDTDSFSPKLTFQGASDHDKFRVEGDLDVGLTTVDFELAGLEEDLYVKLGGLKGLDGFLTQFLGPIGGEAEGLKVLINTINDNWFVINGSLLGANAADNQSSLHPSDAELEAFQDKLSMFNIISVVETFEDEAVNGRLSYHYRLKLNKEDTKSFLDSIVGLAFTGEEITRDSINNAHKLVDRLDEDKTQFDMWIYKDQRQIAKIAYSYEDDDEGKINISVSFDKYDEPIAVEKPEGARSLLELYGELQPLLDSTLPEPASGEDFFEDEFMPSTLGEFLTI